jgi:hypothetical protein
MSGGKGGRSQQTSNQTGTSEAINRVPPFSEGLGINNILKADAISGMGPIRNYGPTVAAFNPTQTASFQNTANTANAFGMGAPTDIMAGMPAATDFGGGVMGISAAPIVDNSLSMLEANDPGQYAEMTGMYMDPVTGARPTSGPFAPINPGILENILDEYSNLRIT